MADSGGFYLMHRGWQDHPVFRGEQFSRRDAFVWLIEEAAFTERRVSLPQGEITLRRGQLAHSIRFMAKAWSWDEKKVRRFLASAERWQITALETAAGQTVVTICNYEKYQALNKQAAAPTAAAAPQQRRGGAANKKEGNEGNKGNIPPIGGTRATRLPADFAPILTDAARSTVEAWPPGMLERELAQFKDRATAKGETYKDWQAAFRTWIRNADKWRTQRGSGQSRTGYGSTVDAIEEWVNER